MRKLKFMGLIFAGLLAMSITAAQAEVVDDIVEALQGGKVSGTIGNYFEYKDVDGGNNGGWSTTYLTLKYETADWNNFKAGVRFFAHGESYNDSEDGSEKFDGPTLDVEKEVTLPELYLSYMFGEKSNVTVGRFNHQKISHIDDAQSEGGYLQYNELEDLGITIGAIRSFAEIDYDDGEDFGRTNDDQDLSDEGKYGSNSNPYMMFAELEYKGLDMITLNPYAYYQDGYAGVYGLDTKLSLEADDIKYGLKTNLYYVDADITGSDNSTNWMISPFVKTGPLSFEGGYGQYGDDANSMYKPEWFSDYMVPLDQLNHTVGAKYDQQVYWLKAKLTLGKFWTHVAYTEAEYKTATVNDAELRENEFQVGYKVTKNLALNARAFIVEFDNVSDADYEKVETSVTLKF